MATSSVLTNLRATVENGRRSRFAIERGRPFAGTASAVDASGRELRMVLFEDLADLNRLRDCWRRLIAEASTDSGFLTWEWLYHWSCQFIRNSRRLFVVAVLRDAEVIAIAPWYVDVVRVGPARIRQIGFLGLPEAASDYLNVIVNKSNEKIVADALIAWLFGPLSSRWDTLALRDIPADSAFLSRFISRLRASGKHYVVEEGAFCPRVTLPATFDLYLARLSGHGRQAYRRKMRALLSSGRVEHVVLRGEQQVRPALGTLRELYERRWGHGQAVRDLFGLVDSYLRHSSEGWGVELSLLHVDDKPVAGLLHFTSGRTKYQYLMAVDRSFRPKISIGNLICGLNIEHAIETGMREYDFLKSEEEYKFQFMTDGRRALNLTLYNRTLRSLAAWSVRAAQSTGKILIR